MPSADLYKSEFVVNLFTHSVLKTYNVELIIVSQVPKTHGNMCTFMQRTVHPEGRAGGVTPRYLHGPCKAPWDEVQATMTAQETRSHPGSQATTPSLARDSSGLCPLSCVAINSASFQMYPSLGNKFNGRLIPEKGLLELRLAERTGRR